MDKNGDGVISKDEWKVWCKRQLEFESDVEDAADVEGMFLSDQEQIEEKFRQLDIDGNGLIDYAEI